MSFRAPDRVVCRNPPGAAPPVAINLSVGKLTQGGLATPARGGGLETDTPSTPEKMSDKRPPAVVERGADPPSISREEEEKVP